MKKLLTTITLTLILAIPSNIFAGDYAELNYIGMSENGKYMAFEEYGEQDGSGYSYSNIYFLDVDQNKYASPPVKILLGDTDGIEAVRKKARRSAAANLKKYEIIEGHSGKLVVARLLTDSNFEFDPYNDSKKIQTIRFKSEIGSMYSRGDYEITLALILIEEKNDYTDNPVYGLDLTLRDRVNDVLYKLQQDKSIPESRGLPISYTMQSIYLFKNKIIVFLNVFSTGFEGPDMRYMVVTGTIKAE